MLRAVSVEVEAMAGACRGIRTPKPNGVLKASRLCVARRFTSERLLCCPLVAVDRLMVCWGVVADGAI